jgi:hypothetical protein
MNASRGKKNTKNFRLVRFHRGQTTTETAILMMVLVFAFFAMQTYLKRAVQGRIKGDIDQIGSQYDFAATTSDFTQTHRSNVTTISSTTIQPVPVPGSGGGTIDRSVTTSLSTTHYDDTTRRGTETVANP